METISSAASLSFEPVQSEAIVGTPFDIQLNIFSDREAVLSTDVWISYDPAVLQPILPVKEGALFASTDAKIITPGTLYMYGIRRDPTTAGVANGTIATLSFRPLKDTATTLRIQCGNTQLIHSQIIKNDTSLNNILNCERTAAHTATITVGNSQVLGTSTQTVRPALMWQLTAAVALLILGVLLYSRNRKLARQEVQE